MSVAILALRPEPDAIRERRLQHIEVAPVHVRVLVRNEAREVLAYSLSHDSSFAMMHREPFLVQNRSHVCSKSLGPAFEFFIARKRQVIGVTCVLRARG